MPTFSPDSLAKLRTCDARLQRVLERAIKDVDFKVLEGHRGQQAQDRAVAEGRSQVSWPNGNHNAYPSRAVDIAPYPVDFGGPLVEIGDDGKPRVNHKNLTALKRFYYLAGFVLAIASTMGIRLRWGGAWRDLADGDLGDLNDPRQFNDLPHFEIVD